MYYDLNIIGIWLSELSNVCLPIFPLHHVHIFKTSTNTKESYVSFLSASAGYKGLMLYHHL